MTLTIQESLGSFSSHFSVSFDALQVEEEEEEGVAVITLE